MTQSSSVVGTSLAASSKEDIEGFMSTEDARNYQYNRRFSAQSTLEGPGILEYAGTEDEPEEPETALRNDSSSVIRFYPEWCHCLECLKRKGRDNAKNNSCMENARNAFLCPPQGPSARICSFLLVFILGWMFLWILLENVIPGLPSAASPKGPLFALGVLEILGLFAGILMKCVGLPSLLDILRDGTQEIVKATVIVRILPVSTLAIGLSQFALTMILTRAGLELSPKQLKKLKGVVPLLAFGPCLVEACCCALFTYIFFNLIGVEKIGISMCFVSGFALAAVSPAVVVPGMLSLKKRNLGVGQGIPTLLIAASSIDDVLAISLYTIFMGIALQTGDEGSWHDYIGGPLGVAVGLAHGFLLGIFLHFIPARDNKNKARTRLVLLLFFNFVSMFGYELNELLSGASSLAVLATSFIASFGWRSQPHWKRPMKKIERSLAHLWTLCVPLLFGTIGREIDFFGEGFAPARVRKILAIIFICLFVRCCVAFLIVGFVKLNYKERLFCALSWIPKATVQAALAPLVLSKIQEKGEGSKGLVQHGQIVVTTAVLAILLTAPSGSVLIATFGSRLLKVATAPERLTLEDEFPNGDGIDPVEEPDEEPLRISASKGFVIKKNENGGSVGSVVSMDGNIKSLINEEENPRRTNSAAAVLGTSETPSRHSGGTIMGNVPSFHSIMHSKSNVSKPK